MKRAVIFILGIGLWSACGIEPVTHQSYAVTFRVLPDSLPDNGQVFITGNQDLLGNWSSGATALLPQPDGSWRRTFSFPSGTNLEYKFTRGSWRTEAVDAAGLEYPNFSLTVDRDTVVNIVIPGWRDRWAGITALSAARLANKAGRIELFENWRYHPGDDLAWADPAYDDSAWAEANTQLPPGEPPPGGWPGIGWFRLHLQVDSSLQHVPLAFIMSHIGASEVYMDGKLLYRYGSVEQPGSPERAYLERNPRHIIFNDTNHLLAVRYSNTSTAFFTASGVNGGFGILLGGLDDFIANRTAQVRLMSIYQIVFSVVPLTLALIHLLLFLFYPPARENLFYAICLIGFAGISFFSFYPALTGEVSQYVWSQRLELLSLMLAICFGLLTLYSRGYERLPRQYLLILLVAAILLVVVWIYPGLANLLVLYGFLIVASLELLRVILRFYAQNRRESWLIGVGFVGLICGIAYQLLVNAGLLPPPFGDGVVYVYGVLVLSIATSINLALDFARSHRRLLEQERSAREQEIQHRLLEADVARKTRELEEARKLQLSMLPKELPEVPGLEIAVYMQTASEVGGDYYDFRHDADGTLTVVVGDATGHGTRAGIMVALIKSLFNTMGNTFFLPDFFQHCTRSIRKMNFGNLYMALLLARFRGGQMTVSAAGMPPALIYRKQSHAVEELLIKGLPLGGPEGYAYQQKQVKLHPGDTVLLMSDGYSELFNDRNEIFDDDRVKAAFREAAAGSPREIIAHLNRVGDHWRNGRRTEDDITFVVLKVTSSSPSQITR